MTVITAAKSEAQELVLFDEDYRAHIARLDSLLLRERNAVWDLRQQVRRLQEQLRDVTTNKETICTMAMEGMSESEIRKVRLGNRTFVCRRNA